MLGKKKKIEKQHNSPDEMTFLEHLEELRWHLVRASAAIIVSAIVVFANYRFIFDSILLKPKNPDFVTNRAFAWVAERFNSPELAINTKPFELININRSGQCSTRLMSAIVGGMIVAIPYIFWEFWRFIKPALYEKERKHASGAVFFSSLLFFLGVGFGYFLIVPLTTHFFGSYQVSEQVANEINLNSYISSIASVVLGSGIIFESPIIIYFLSKVGIISSDFLRTYRKHAIIILLLLAAIITPPDIFSMMLVTLPLVLLYELGIIIAGRIEKKRDRDEQLLEA